MSMIFLGMVKPEALAEHATALTAASRDVAAFSLATDEMIPQVALGLALQACVRHAVELGGIELIDVLGAYGSAMAGVICDNASTVEGQNRLGLEATRSLKCSVEAVRAKRQAGGQA